MLNPAEKYISKLIRSGSAVPGSIRFGIIDDTVAWNSLHEDNERLEKIAASLSISSILFVRPPEPMFSIMNILASEAADGIIKPIDAEARTFLHEIPVIGKFEIPSIAKILKKRKSLIVKDAGIITHGSVSAEQAYVTYCSVLFSLWIKFFTDIINSPTQDKTALARESLKIYEKSLRNFSADFHHTGTLSDPKKITAAMSEAGRAVVECGLVDSFFGNISFKTRDSIYISRTGSSLDELEDEIERCPLDKSSTASITASSEFSAHRAVYEIKKCSSILHGHPKFAVIISMLCDDNNCATRGRCHTSCSRQRFIEDIPIVPGEVGTGKFGLNRTLPASLTGRGSIVWGHGLFTTGDIDFTDAFKSMIDIELMCVDSYKNRLYHLTE